MANDARTQFIDGLRVSAEHLQHMQDRLRESVLDVRNTIGLGRVAWGLRATLNGSAVEITPGVAFARSGVRLAVDTPVSLRVPDDAGAAVAVVLRGVSGDREALRFGGLPTLITLTTRAEIAAAPPSTELDAFVLATVNRGADGLSLVQGDELFVAAGTHAHSGQHVQDADGRWHFDGAPLADLLPDGTIPGPPGPARACRASWCSGERGGARADGAARGSRACRGGGSCGRRWCARAGRPAG